MANTSRPGKVTQAEIDEINAIRKELLPPRPPLTPAEVEAANKVRARFIEREVAEPVPPPAPPSAERVASSWRAWDVAQRHFLLAAAPGIKAAALAAKHKAKSRKGGENAGAAKKRAAAPVHDKVIGDALAMVRAGHPGHEVAEKLAKRHGRSSRQVRRIIEKYRKENDNWPLSVLAKRRT